MPYPLTLACSITENHFYYLCRFILPDIRSTNSFDDQSAQKKLDPVFVPRSR